MSLRDDTPPLHVKLPADIGRDDTLIGNFTARQLIIMASTGVGLWLLWAATKTTLPSMVFLAIAVPVGGMGFLLAVSRREGISLDRWLVALIRHSRTPHRLVPGDGTGSPAPKWVASNGDKPNVVVAPLKLPAKGITAQGLVDLGPDGTAALIVCSTVNFGLRSHAEQHALVGAYARWLNSLDAPVQILVRSRRVDLSVLAGRLEDGAADLPDQALEDAARYHADFLRRLAAQRELLHRDVIVVIRDTRSPAHTLHRAAETVRALAACEITATVADQDQAAAIWAQCTGAQALPPGQAPADAVIRATPRSTT